MAEAQNDVYSTALLDAYSMLPRLASSTFLFHNTSVAS